MRVKHQISRVRCCRPLFLSGWTRCGRLRRMVMVVVAAGMRMEVPGRQACRHHRYQQQQPRQPPEGAVDPEAHTALEG